MFVRRKSGSFSVFARKYTDATRNCRFTWLTLGSWTNKRGAIALRGAIQNAADHLNVEVEWDFAVEKIKGLSESVAQELADNL